MFHPLTENTNHKLHKFRQKCLLAYKSSSSMQMPSKMIASTYFFIIFAIKIKKSGISTIKWYLMLCINTILVRTKMVRSTSGGNVHVRPNMMSSTNEHFYVVELVLVEPFVFGFEWRITVRSTMFRGGRNLFNVLFCSLFLFRCLCSSVLCVIFDFLKASAIPKTHWEKSNKTTTKLNLTIHHHVCVSQSQMENHNFLC